MQKTYVTMIVFITKSSQRIPFIIIWARKNHFKCKLEMIINLTTNTSDIEGRLGDRLIRIVAESQTDL